MAKSLILYLEAVLFKQVTHLLDLEEEVVPAPIIVGLMVFLTTSAFGIEH